MNTRFVTFILLLFLGMNNVYAQSQPKLYRIFSPDKKSVMAVQPHNDGSLTYTFTTDGEILIKESPLGFKLESQETVPSSGWKIESVSDRQVRDEWRPLWGKRAVVEDHFNESVIDLQNPAGQPKSLLSYNPKEANRFSRWLPSRLVCRRDTLRPGESFCMERHPEL